MGSGSLVSSGELVVAGSDVSIDGPSLVVGSPLVGSGSDVSPDIVVVEVGADVAEVEVGELVVAGEVGSEDVAVVGELVVGAGVDVTGGGVTPVDGAVVTGAVPLGTTAGPGSSESLHALVNRKIERLPRSARKEWEEEEVGERRIMTKLQCLSRSASANEMRGPRWAGI